MLGSAGLEGKKNQDVIAELREKCLKEIMILYNHKKKTERKKKTL